MHRDPSHFIVSNRDLTSLADWQAALDSLDFLVPLRLSALILDGSELSYGFLGEHRVEFLCERRNFDDVWRKPGLETEGPWSVCYACQGFGLIDVAAAGSMVALAFAQTTGGAFFNSYRGIARHFADTKVQLDGLLAVALNRDDLFAARYPELAAEKGDGPYDTLVVRVWQGDRMTLQDVVELQPRNRD